jgi:hypothetical protein
MVDWCIDELRYKAKVFEETGAVTVYNGDVVKSDTAVPAALKTMLREAVAPLEEVPAREKDWHPGSDEKVLDLVHPSLFPLVYGRSRILPDTLVGLDDCIERCGEGITIPIAPNDPVLIPNTPVSAGNLESFSKKFQWLPCDVDIAGDNDSVRYVFGRVPDFRSSMRQLAFQDHQLYQQLASSKIQGPVFNHRENNRLHNSSLEPYSHPLECSQYRGQFLPPHHLLWGVRS